MNHSAHKPRVAFVVQRCGRAVNGGAESLCLQVAQRMAPWWETEVLTTCALDYVTWRNYFPEGTEECDGTLIRRFKTERERDIEEFNLLSGSLLAKQRVCTLGEQRLWLRSQGPHSPSLSAHIAANRDTFDAFVFFCYLYSSTFDNLPLVAEKAWLAPLTHDEWPLGFSIFDRLFALPRGFIFNTPAERAFTQDRFFHLRIDGPVAGVGIEPPPDGEPGRFRKKHGIAGPFLLYCGRIDPSKGCEEMFTAFLRWKQSCSLPHKLVLIGKPVMPVPSHPDIRCVGFVPESEKWDAMAACDWLIQPSPYESLSLVLLETWAMGRPALVNAKCAVLAEHCSESRGGLAFSNWDEAMVAVELTDAGQKAALGTNGRNYVAERYTWRHVCDAYRAEIVLPRNSAEP